MDHTARHQMVAATVRPTRVVTPGCRVVTPGGCQIAIGYAHHAARHQSVFFSEVSVWQDAK
jgi:hypothetical protein